MERIMVPALKARVIIEWLKKQKRCGPCGMLLLALVMILIIIMAILLGIFLMGKVGDSWNNKTPKGNEMPGYLKVQFIKDGKLYEYGFGARRGVEFSANISSLGFLYIRATTGSQIPLVMTELDLTHPRTIAKETLRGYLHSTEKLINGIYETKQPFTKPIYDFLKTTRSHVNEILSTSNYISDWLLFNPDVSIEAIEVKEWDFLAKVIPWIFSYYDKFPRKELDYCLDSEVDNSCGYNNATIG